MTFDTGTFEYVLGSAARREVLAALETAAAPRPEVVASAEASESSIYAALNELRERGLVCERDDEWRLTGAGRLVADVLFRLESIDRVLDADADYWRTHDATALPERFRTALSAFEGYEVVRSPETDPYRANRRVEEAIEEAAVVDIATPIYHDRYAEALLASPAERKRLVMTPEMAADLSDGGPAGVDPAEEADMSSVEVRIAATDLAMTVTDDALLLSLPRLDGTYDRETELAVETESAVEWGRRLYDSIWREATPVERFEDPSR